MRLVLEPQQPVTESSRLSAELRCSEPCRATADATTPPDDTPVPVTIDGVAGEPRTRHPLAIVFPEQVRSYLLDEVEAGRSVPITVRLTAIDDTGRTVRAHGDRHATPARVHQMITGTAPPSTDQAAPATLAARSEHSTTTTPATSSSVPKRPERDLRRLSLERLVAG